jgi:hypothetical protein
MTGLSVCGSCSGAWLSKESKKKLVKSDEPEQSEEEELESS